MGLFKRIEQGQTNNNNAADLPASYEAKTTPAHISKIMREVDANVARFNKSRSITNVDRATEADSSTATNLLESFISLFK